MKKLYFALFFLIASALLISGDSADKEEIDFLLFMPNSSGEFVYRDEAADQLDKLAKYLMERDLVPGQINVYGYAAYSPNDVDEMELSKNRALHVINELQRRGVPGNLFSVPEGFGSVDLWGSNAGENDKAPNRRVRILLDGSLVTPLEVKTAQTEIVTVSEDDSGEEVIPVVATAGKRSFNIFWIILPLLLIVAIFAAVLLRERRNKRLKEAQKTDLQKSPEEEVKEPPIAVVEPVITPAPPPVTAPVTTPVSGPAVVPSMVTTRVAVDLDEEIRRCAYINYLRRSGGDPDATQDWYMAVDEVSSRYDAEGYRTVLTAGGWQAVKETKSVI